MLQGTCVAALPAASLTLLKKKAREDNENEGYS